MRRWIPKIAAGGGGGGFTRATGNYGADTSGGSSTTQAAAAFNLAAGSLVIVGARSEGNGSGITSVSDTAGNTYTALTQQGSGSTKARLFYCLSASAHATNVVTVTYGNSCEYRAVAAQSYTYTGTASLVDEDGATGNSTSPVTPAMTAGALGAGLLAEETHAAATPNAGWTETHASNAAGMHFLDRVDSPGGTITCGATTPDWYWFIAGATFTVS